jgi:hypothetical protein
MKFLALALTAAVGFTEGRKLNASELKHRVQNGLVNKSVLMRGAKPYNAAAKRVLEEDQGFEITGKYSIQFNSCTSMTVQSDDLMEDANLIAMASNGDLIADKDYILFNVCETDMCAYYGDDQKMTFIAEVGTYFQAISQYLPNKVNEYCEACEANYDYCYAQSIGQTYYPEGYEPEEEEAQEEEQEEAQEEGQEEGEQEGEEGEERNRKARKLAKKHAGRKLNGQDGILKFVDCDMCADYECLDFNTKTSNGYYDEDGAYVEAELDEAMEWLNGFSECAETNAYMDDYQLYSGLMCNAKGTGLEIGLFLDEECTLYTPKLAFKNIMQSADVTYYNMIQDIVEFTFTNDGIECYDPEVTWYNKIDYYYEQLEKAENGEEEEEEQDEEQEEPQAAEWCQELVQDDAAVDLYDCDYEAPEQNDDEEADQYLGSYDWYSYELKEDQIDDISSVCAIYTGLAVAANAEYDQKKGGYKAYKPKTVYNGQNEGLFDYEKKSSGSNGGKIFGIILLVAVVGGGAAAFFMQKKESSKKQPLISENEGTLA